VVGGIVVERISEVDLEPVATALASEEGAVRMQFGEALNKLSDRHNPDYRNSR